MNIPLTLKEMEKGGKPNAYITQVCDQRIALFDAIIDSNGDELFLLNGKNAEKRNVLQESPMYYEEDFTDEVRTFRILDHSKYLKIEDFNVWYDLQSFFDHYQELTPEKIKMSIKDKIILPFH
jgi:hypothetical protein